jgi:hypothetical protein
MRLFFSCAVLATVTLAQPIPPHPNLFNNFVAEAIISVNATDRNTGHPLIGTGSGHFARDEDAGRSVQTDTFVQPDLMTLNVWELERWDLKRRFAIENGGDCLSFAIMPPMPHVWDWVRRAYFGGTISVNGKEVHRWIDRDSWTGVERELGVTAEDPKTPVWFVLMDRWGNGEYKYVFQRYLNVKPSPSEFDIPRKCPNPVFVDGEQK